MLEMIMNKKEEDLQWLVNVDSIYENFQNVPFFDESLRFEKKTAYHLVGERSNQYPFDKY
jgi:hypothetical protein